MDEPNSNQSRLKQRTSARISEITSSKRARIFSCSDRHRTRKNRFSVRSIFHFLKRARVHLSRRSRFVSGRLGYRIKFGERSVDRHTSQFPKNPQRTGLPHLSDVVPAFRYWNTPRTNSLFSPKRRCASVLELYRSGFKSRTRRAVRIDSEMVSM